MTYINNKNLEKDSNATPFSRFFWAVLRNDWKTAESQLADDIEWDTMSNEQMRKGKSIVLPWLKTGKYSSQTAPIPVSNRADKEWGVWEYWNVGTIEKGIIEFAKQSNWPFPTNVTSLIGRKYEVPVCFIYHIDSSERIDLVREYLDVSSIVAQLD